MAIALKYRDTKADIMSEAVTQIAQQLDSLAKEIGRLDHYLSLIDEEMSSTIRKLFIEKKAITQVAVEMNIARGTVINRRNIAIDELSSMYEFIGNVK